MNDDWSQRQFFVLAVILVTATGLIGACETTQSGRAGGLEGPALPTHKDKGPVLERKRDELAMTEESQIRLESDAAARHNGHWYLRVPVPESAEQLRWRLYLSELWANSNRHTVAASGSSADEPALYLRVVGEERPSTIRLQAVFPRRETNPPRKHDTEPRFSSTVIKVEVPEDTVTGEELPSKTFEVLAEAFEEMSSQLVRGAKPAEYFSYASYRLHTRSLELEQKVSGAAAKSGPDTLEQPERERWMREAIERITGREALSETLQVDRSLRSQGEGKRTIPVGELEPPELPSHPWEKLLNSEQDMSKESLAELVPSDRIYIRFAQLREFIDTLDHTGTQLAPLLGSISGAQQMNGLTGWYENQLGLKPSGFAKRFGDLAVKDVGVLLDDPYLRAGTGITLVFHTETPGLVKELLDEQLSESELSSNVDAEEIEIGGYTVRKYATRDRRLSQFRLSLENAVVVSNSPAPLRAMTEVLADRAPALADKSGFTFMRDYYPADQERTGFLYFGEDFVERFIGPRYRIAQARRMQARSRLKALQYAPMLYGWMEGAWPESNEALTQTNYLLRTTEHSDGTPIEFNLKNGAFSSWGTSKRGLPVSEVNVQNVTKSEKEAYESFARQYSRLGFEYIDPVGIAFNRTEEKTTFDLRVTPFPEWSEYYSLVELLGRTQLKENPTTHGFQWVFGIGENSEFRRALDRYSSMIVRARNIEFDWLGTWAAIGAADRSGIWDGALLAQLIPSSGGNQYLRLSEMTRKKIEALNRLPVWFALDVESPAGFGTFMAGIRQFTGGFGSNVVSWKPAKPYRKVDISSVQFTVKPRAPTLDLYFTVVDGVFILSPDRQTVEHRIDALKAGYRPQPSIQAQGDETPKAGPQMEVSFGPNGPNSWLERTLLGLVEKAQAYRLPTTRTAFLAARRAWPTLGAEQLETRANSWAQFRLRNPHGRLLKKAESGYLVDPLYGLISSRLTRTQKIPKLPVRPSPITRWIDSLERASADLSIERHGEATGMHVKTQMHWE